MPFSSKRSVATTCQGRSGRGVAISSLGLFSLCKAQTLHCSTRSWISLLSPGRAFGPLMAFGDSLISLMDLIQVLKSYGGWDKDRGCFE